MRSRILNATTDEKLTLAKSGREQTIVQKDSSAVLYCTILYCTYLVQALLSLHLSSIAHPDHY
jgi:hypothetical protein